VTSTSTYVRCRKCGMFPSEHVGDVCSPLFDPYHTTGRPDYVRVTGSKADAPSPEDFVRQHAPKDGE
jgi:hypothetical protein